MIYEPANLVQCAEPYGVSTIRALAPHILNVYFQNLRESPDGESVANPWCRGEVRFDQVTMWGGEGVDFPGIMAALKGIGYEGYVTLHQSATPPTRPRSSSGRPPTTCGGWPISSSHAAHACGLLSLDGLTRVGKQNRSYDQANAASACHSERSEESRVPAYGRRCLAVSDLRFFTPLRFVQNDSAGVVFSSMASGPIVKYLPLSALDGRGLR